MKCEVLRDFTCANDARGITGTKLEIGQFHDVPHHLVASLQAEGYVKPVSGGPLDHDDDGKKGGSTPGQAGDAPMPVADLLAAAEAEPPMDWHTFRAEAKKILGEDCPSKKDEIIDALKARAAAEAEPKSGAGTEQQPDA